MLDIPKRRHKHFDLTPLVDIMFNLLLFFILSYQVSKFSKINVNIPESKIFDIKTKAVELTVKSENDIYLDNRKVSISELSVVLSSVPSKESININIDKNLKIDILVKIIDEVKLSGFKSFNIITAVK